MRHFVAACTQLEAPIRQRVFAVLVAIAVLVDLCAYDLSRFHVWGPHQFHMPWLPAWPELVPSPAAALALYAATCVASLGATALYCGSRLGALAVLVVYAYTFLDHQPNYTNNGVLLLVSLAVLAASDLRGTTPAWPRRVGQVTLSAMYLGAGLSKLDGYFLSGRVLSQALTFYGNRYASWIGLSSPPVFAAASWAAMVLELGLGVGLWFPRTRAVVVPLGIVFHLVVEALMPVRFFSFLCMAGYALFTEAETLERWTSRARSLVHPVVGLLAAVCVLGMLESFWYGVAPVSAAIVACSMLGGSAVWGRRPQQQALVPARRSPRWGPAIVMSAIALQSFCVCKPWLGWSKRFAWHMFSELLIVRIETQVESGGRFHIARFPGAQSRWRENGRRYHWTSWSEEQIYLAGYAAWLAQTFDVRTVRVVAYYQQNDTPEQRVEFIGRNPAGSVF